MITLENRIGEPGSPASLGPTVIGEEFGGGYYAGTVGGYYIICPPISGQNSNIQWKTTDTATAGTTSLVDGYANTQAMVTGGIELHPAASFCINLTINSFSDWYFPAKDEMDLLYTNKTVLTSAGAGSFNDTDAYWCSSASSSTAAWNIYFVDGSWDDVSSKPNSYSLRAIRRVAI